MKRGLRPVLGLAVVGTALLGPGIGAAAAHPLGNFSVNRYSGVVVGRHEVRVDHVLDLAEIPTAQLGALVNQPAELADRRCTAAARQLRLTVGGQRHRLRPERAATSVRPGQAGLDVVRVVCALAARIEPLRAPTTLHLVDGGAARAGWREMTARGDGTTVLRADVPTRSVSHRLTRYPDRLLSSPADVRELTMRVRPGGPRLTADAVRGPPAGLSGGFDAGFGDRVAGLVAEPGPLVAVLALLAALALGAAHAVAPGHGKTVMACYLAGRRTGSVKAAATVGVTVTAAHTTGVLAVGLAVTAGAVVLPDRLYGWLTVLSGLLIAVVGVALLRRAVRGHGHTHAHDHHHGHAHPHQQPRPAEGGRAGLVALGLAGGVVPSPSAVLLLLAAVGAGRPLFGLVLVVAFGAGMATTLSVVGLLASGLTHRLDLSAVTRPGLRRITRLVPLGAASGVCLVGVGVAARALGSTL